MDESERASPTLARCENSVSVSMKQRRAAAHIEAEYRARAARQKTLRQRVISMRRQFGISHAFDRRRTQQKIDDLRVLATCRSMRKGNVSMP